MSTCCPFCGLSTAIPHETQEGCIEALHAEIARVRDVLDHVHSTSVPSPTDPSEDEGPPLPPEAEGVKPGSDRGQTPV